MLAGHGQSESCADTSERGRSDAKAQEEVRVQQRRIDAQQQPQQRWVDPQQQPPQEQPKTRYPRIGSSGPQQAPSYHFAIGSVEIFERKLEAAQRQLGIEPRDFVPVQYVSETNWAAEGAKFQMVAIVPTKDLVAVRLGESQGTEFPAIKEPFGPLISAFPDRGAE